MEDDCVKERIKKVLIPDLHQYLLGESLICNGEHCSTMFNILNGVLLDGDEGDDWMFWKEAA